MDDDGFVVVRSRRKKNNSDGPNQSFQACNKICKTNLQRIQDNGEKEVDEQFYCQKIKQCETEFARSEFFQKFVNGVLGRHKLVIACDISVKPNKKISSANIISKIICLGIGSFTLNKEAEYQLIFLRCLAEVLGLKTDSEQKSVLVFDPIHTKNEQKIIRQLGFDLMPMEQNLEGKYSLKEEKMSGTLFYLPHCPKQLTNNLLWANWDRQTIASIDPANSVDNSVRGLYILGNSFERLTSSLPDRILKESAEYILIASKYAKETKIENCFKFSDIFNDTSLHSFPIHNLPPSSDPMWKIAKIQGPPIYREEDPREFIKKGS